MSFAKWFSLKSYVLGICTIFFIVIVIIAVRFDLIFGRHDAGDPILRALEIEVSRSEKRAGLGCQDLRSGIRTTLSNDVIPVLDAYAKGANWKAELQTKSKRIDDVNALLSACASRQTHIQRFGGIVPYPLTQSLVFDFGSIHAFLLIGLNADTCGQACVDTQMQLVNSNRLQLMKELQND